MNVALKKKDVSDPEYDFFFKNLFTLSNFLDWRKAEKPFIDIEEKVEKSRFYAFKREILKLYPDMGRKVMEYLEKELGQTFSYKQASITLYAKAYSQHSEFK